MNIVKLALSLCLSSFIVACSISPVVQRHIDTSYSDLTTNKLAEGNQPLYFSLPDSSGKQISLKQELAENNVLLLFYRGEWCPYCIDQLDGLQAVLPELQQYNVKLIAISPDDEATIQNTKRKFGQNYTFLSDKNLTASQLYGITKNEKLPHPAVYLISKQNSDKKSKIEWMYVSKDHTKRPSGKQLLEKAKAVFKQ